MTSIIDGRKFSSCKETEMKDKAMMMYDHIRSSVDVDPWAIEELRKILEVYLVDGCSGCIYEEMAEWNMPCQKCRRNTKDYYKNFQ